MASILEIRPGEETLSTIQPFIKREGVNFSIGHLLISILIRKSSVKYTHLLVKVLSGAESFSELNLLEGDLLNIRVQLGHLSTGQKMNKSGLAIKVLIDREVVWSVGSLVVWSVGT